MTDHERQLLNDYVAACRVALCVAFPQGVVTITLSPLDQAVALGQDRWYPTARPTRWQFHAWVQVSAQVNTNAVYVQPAPPLVFSQVVEAGTALPSPEKLAKLMRDLADGPKECLALTGEVPTEKAEAD